MRGRSAGPMQYCAERHVHAFKSRIPSRQLQRGNRGEQVVLSVAHRRHLEASITALRSAHPPGSRSHLVAPMSVVLSGTRGPVWSRSIVAVIRGVPSMSFGALKVWDSPCRNPYRARECRRGRCSPQSATPNLTAVRRADDKSVMSGPGRAGQLPQLHLAILWGTGWQGGHLHELVFEEANYGPTSLSRICSVPFAPALGAAARHPRAARLCLRPVAHPARSPVPPRRHLPVRFPDGRWSHGSGSRWHSSSSRRDARRDHQRSSTRS